MEELSRVAQLNCCWNQSTRGAPLVRLRRMPPCRLSIGLPIVCQYVRAGATYRAIAGLAMLLAGLCYNRSNSK